VKVGSRLLQLALDRGARTISVVGTAKGVGKTTALLAIYRAAVDAQLRVGFASAGYRARLPLRAGTLFATARTLLPAAPATIVVCASSLQTPAGALVYARAMHDGDYDVIGPSTAAGLREAVEFLNAHGDVVLVDGAVNRLAMLAGGTGAIVVACGAAGAKSETEAIAEVAALIERLRVPVVDSDDDIVAVPNALTPSIAGELMRRGETRQIVVNDATQIALHGGGLARALSLLRVRCRFPLNVVAATTCALAPERSFEPARFSDAVARRTGLAAFDVFAAREAA
jgi:hypothetical protein